jgi:protein gp37
MSTGIQWTDETWNPVTGCSRVSDDCRNCYAETLTKRYHPDSFRPWTHSNAPYNVQLHPERLDKPLHWRKPRRIFVNSMSDLFHEQVPFEFIARVYFTMIKANQHTYQILSKRPERMAEFLEWFLSNGRFEGSGHPVEEEHLRHILHGTSVENQREANSRIRAIVRLRSIFRSISPIIFLSCEPLLALLNLSEWLDIFHHDQEDAFDDAGWYPFPDSTPQPLIDWVIVGGESGPHHRPIREEWVRDLRDQCTTAHVAFFFKQWGGATPKAGGRLLDGREWDEMPEVRHA